jgi:hypothetical protein
MGGKPSKGTPADGRIKGNSGSKGTGKGSSSTGQGKGKGK